VIFAFFREIGSLRNIGNMKRQTGNVSNRKVVPSLSTTETEEPLMKRKKIQSDSERLKLLTNLVAHAEITNPSGSPVFGPHTITHIQALVDTFTDAVAARKESIYTRRDGRLELERALTELKTEIRILWRTIRGWVHIGEAPPTRFVLYRLDPNGNQPGYTGSRGWLRLGDQIVAGDLIAEASGSQSLGAADRTKLTGSITRVSEAIENLERGSSRENKSIQQPATIRDRVDKEIRKVAMRIEIAFIEHTALSKRKTMRVLGFAFVGDPRGPHRI